MNIEPVKSLFALFSGVDNPQDYISIVTLAMLETERMLRDDADRSDIRLEFLCAATANYRLQQINAAHDRSIQVYAGELSQGKNSNVLLNNAERLLTDYLNMCADLIVPKTFMFINTGKELCDND